MTIEDFIKALEREIPLGAAHSPDPVGLQVGDPRTTLRGIVVAHDVDVATVKLAARLRANLIVCYHPVIFSPLARLDARDPAAQVPLALAQHRIMAYAVHTAFDTHPEGTNSLLGRALGLRNMEPLVPLRDALCKISVFVPASSVEKVSQAMWNAGAGRIGDYEECSFRSEGTGTFFGGRSTTPHVGERGSRERVKEVRLEMTCPSWLVNAVTTSMRSAHPYEEIAFDVVQMKNPIADRGMGMVGDLQEESLQWLIARVKRVCGAKRVRTNGRMDARVSRVAVIGGSGGSFLGDAVRARADVLITGDVRYHTFRSAEGRIAVIDAGHAETERFVAGGLAAIVRRLLRSSKNSHIRTVRAKTSNNFILYV